MNAALGIRSHGVRLCWPQECRGADAGSGQRLFNDLFEMLLHFVGTCIIKWLSQIELTVWEWKYKIIGRWYPIYKPTVFTHALNNRTKWISLWWIFQLQCSAQFLSVLCILSKIFGSCGFSSRRQWHATTEKGPCHLFNSNCL